MVARQEPEAATSAAERAARAAVRQPRPAGPEFVTIGQYQAPAGRHAAPHRYRVWKLTRYQSGSIDAYVDGIRHPVVKGSILAIPPGVSHAERAHTAYSNTYLLINAPRQWPWPLTPVHEQTSSLDIAFSALSEEAIRSDPFAATMISALITQIDITLRRATDNAGLSRPAAIVNTVERLFAQHHAETVKISEIAHQVGVSASTLRAYFVRELGTSPQARLRQIRLQYAMLLLRTSDLTVEAIATRSGYHSASHLSRHLKATDGRPPGDLRGPAVTVTPTRAERSDH